MKIEDLHNGFFRLTAPNGVVDIRTNTIYSEAVVPQKHIKYFKSVDEHTLFEILE